MLLPLMMGCARSKKANIVIVAVDQLSFAEANCSREASESASGIGVVCSESVRWTHAYTPNIMSGPALASLLTGLHPVDLGYRHNGQFLPPHFTSLGEIAYSKKYRTLFLSGGPPILKKTGLGKGFESFDDSLNLLESPWLKPFRQNVQTFSQWLDDIHERPILAVFYVPDLRFLHRTTLNQAGDLRNKSFESQLDEFDSVLFDLIQVLKKSGRWDQTHFIVAGLQGRNLYDRQEMSPHTNLHSESTQVTLLWKSTQAKRDDPMSRTVDRNVSLADVGATLFDLLGYKPAARLIESSSLLSTLLRPDSSQHSSRLYLLESGWAQWRLGTSIQSNLLLQDELYFHDRKARLYRTLSDRLETNPIFATETQSSSFVIFQKTASDLGLEPFSPPTLDRTSLWNLGYWDWLSPGLVEIRNAYATVPWGQIPLDARPWLARALLEAGDWKGLKSAAESWKNPKLQWLAHAHLGLTPVRSDGCFALLKSGGFTGDESKGCADPAFLEVLSHLQDEGKARRWEKILEEKLILTSVLRMNRALGLVWDVPESFETVLSSVEILFWSPDYRQHLKTVRTRLRAIELESTQPKGL
ncbi:MAG: sulfatase-like hydrolase/transferase [Bdellovibrionales bacterium]